LFWSLKEVAPEQLWNKQTLKILAEIPTESVKTEGKKRKAGAASPPADIT